MPDWRKVVSERLGPTDLSSQEHDEVVSELAAHLQDKCEALRFEGVTEAHAVERALNEFGDANQLGLKIYTARHAEVEMNQRTKSFWLPGLVTLTTSMGWLLILQSRDWPLSQPQFYASPPVLPFAIWLITLPIFGALGTYLSVRAGGSIRARLGAAAFPSMAMMGLLLFVLLFALFVERNHFVWQHPARYILICLPWVVFPAIALLCGALPFLKASRSHAS